MLLKYHIISSALLSILLYPFFGLNVLFVFFAGFLIDVDHYIYYVLRFKDLSLKKSYKYFEEYPEKRHFSDILFIFHTVEFFGLLIILSFYNDIIFLIFTSVSLHQILDMILLYKIDAFESRAFSLIMWLKKNI